MAIGVRDMTVKSRLGFNHLHHLYTYIFYNRTGSCEIWRVHVFESYNFTKNFCTKWNKKIFSLQEISLSPVSNIELLVFCISKLDIQ